MKPIFDGDQMGVWSAIAKSLGFSKPASRETVDGRRIFYVDVGSLTPQQAEELIQKIKAEFASRNLTRPSASET